MENIRKEYGKKRLLNNLLETCAIFRREEDLEALDSMKLIFEESRILLEDYEYQGRNADTMIGLLSILLDKMENDDLIGLVDCLELMFIPAVKEIIENGEAGCYDITTEV